MNPIKILIPVFVLLILIVFSGKSYSQDGTFGNEQTKTDGERIFDKEGYDQFGYNKEGYDRNGYDKQGYNKEGRDSKGNLKGENSNFTTDPNKGSNDIKSGNEIPPNIDKDKSVEQPKDTQKNNSTDSKERKKKKSKKDKNKN